MIHLLLAIIYLSFVSLGLPDGMLGAAWPAMFQELNVTVSSVGIISMIIALGTVVSSLMSDRLTCKLGSGKVTALSVALTAIAMLGFSQSNHFGQLCLWAIPYGLGAGSVDACLNNYVAIHYSSRHMSWLHCMWGVGAATGPSVMGLVLSAGQSWCKGYFLVSGFQIVLSALIFISLPLWKNTDSAVPEKKRKPLTLPQILQIPGAKQIMLAFLAYSAVEQTTALWASGYLTMCKAVPEETAAFFSGLFFVGMTAGRGLNGFLTMRFSNTQLIRLGQGIILLGVAAMLLPIGTGAALVGLILIGLGCAPIYPCIIHSTPHHFGVNQSQALIGVQMASAYVGTCLMPPLFGLVAEYITLSFLPIYLFAFLTIMFFMHEGMLQAIKKESR